MRVIHNNNFACIIILCISATLTIISISSIKIVVGQIDNTFSNSSDTIQWKKYESKEFGFSFEYPYSWNHVLSINPFYNTNTTLIKDDVTKGEVGFSIIKNLPSNITTEDFSKQAIENIQNSPIKKKVIIKPLDMSKYVVDG